MKLRPKSPAVAALALAVAAPLLVVAPASAKADPVDPTVLAQLKAAFVASGQAYDEQGGTIRTSTELDSIGLHGTVRMVIETDARGVARERTGPFPGFGGRSDAYFTADGKVAAVRVGGVVRRALAKHGLHRAPQWYRPTTGVPTRTRITGKDIADTGDQFAADLVALTANTVGDRTTYQLTLSAESPVPGGATSTAQDLTVVTDHGLLASLAGDGSSLRIRYGHAPIVVPKAGTKNRKLIQAESSLSGLGQIAMFTMPAHASKAKRIAKLRRMITATVGVTAGGMRLTSRPIRGGVEVTGTIKSWKHPLTWRYVVKGKSVIPRPVRTA